MIVSLLLRPSVYRYDDLSIRQVSVASLTANMADEAEIAVWISIDVILQVWSCPTYMPEVYHNGQTTSYAKSTESLGMRL